MAKLKEVIDELVLAQLMAKFTQLTDGLSVERLVRPENLAVARAKGLKTARNSHFDSPIFTYNRAALEDAVSRLDELKDLSKTLQFADVGPLNSADRTAIDLFQNRVGDAVATCKLAQAILSGRDADSAQILREKFGLPSQKTVAKANGFITDMKAWKAASARKDPTKDPTKNRIENPVFSEDEVRKLQRKQVSPQEMNSLVKKTLDELGFSNWDVIARPKAVAIMMRDAANAGPSIIIPGEKSLPAFYVAQLIGREIGCRALLSENGRAIFRGLGGGKFKPDDRRLYEGLAVHHDTSYLLKALGHTAILPPPWTVIAVQEAARGAKFASVAQMVFDHKFDISAKNPEKTNSEAWDIAAKVFKGSTNTLNPSQYAYPRDAAQFEGYLQVQDLMRDRKVAPWLYSGIWSKSDVEYLAQHAYLPELKHVYDPELALRVAKELL